MSLLRSPWTLRGAALAAGLAAALAHPPFGLLPGLLGYAAMLWLADAAPSWKSAFLRGWLAGTGYFAVGTWWVAEAFMVDAANQGWMAPFAVAFMAGGIALFWGAALTAYRALRPTGLSRVLVFAGVFAVFECCERDRSVIWNAVASAKFLPSGVAQRNHVTLSPGTRSESLARDSTTRCPQCPSSKFQTPAATPASSRR